MIAYGLAALATVHTMWLHGVFSRRLENFNLYIFYISAISVCIGRYYSFIFLYKALKTDNMNLYTYQFNYGFYVANFAILHIAVSQINRMINATIKSKYLNKRISSGEATEAADMTRQKNELRVLNVATFAICLAGVAYNIFLLYSLHDVYHSNSADAIERINSLIDSTAWFFAASLAVTAVAIWVSFFTMRSELMRSTHTKSVQYKNDLLAGFLTLGLIQLSRSLFSILYIELKHYFLKESVYFGDIILQGLTNLSMDLATICTVLYLNRKIIGQIKQLL